MTQTATTESVSPAAPACPTCADRLVQNGPICEGSWVTLWREGAYSARQCRSCGLVASGAPAAYDFPAGYYEHYLRSERARDMRIRHFRELLDRLPTRLEGPILDVGAGLGFFGQALGEQRRNETTLLEPSEFARRYLERTPAFASVVSSFEEIPDDQVFKTVTFWDVLAHIEDPACVLRTVRERMSPGGVLIVKTPFHPRRLFRGARLLCATRRSHALLHIPSMRYHFVPQSLERLLTETGFRSVARSWAPEPSVSVRSGRAKVKGFLLRQTKRLLAQRLSFVVVARVC